MANECDSENYVAENMGILVSSATMPPLRNIITTATFAQHQQRITAPPSSRAIAL